MPAPVRDHARDEAVFKMYVLRNRRRRNVRDGAVSLYAVADHFGISTCRVAQICRRECRERSIDYHTGLPL